MDLDTASRVEVRDPRIKSYPIGVQIVEYHVAEPYADVATILSNRRGTSIITQAHHEVAVSRCSDLNNLAGMSRSLQNGFDLIYALFTFQNSKSSSCGRRNHQRIDRRHVQSSQQSFLQLQISG
jgi:hypothetical protein